MRRFIWLIAMVSGAASVAAAAQEPQVTPVAITEACAFSVRGTQIECGHLRTALDRTNPTDTRTIEIKYVRLKSRSRTPEPDPVVFLTGGPGSSSLYFLNVLSRSQILEHRDLIAIEQRGNGYSEPNLLCSLPEANDVRSTRAAYRSCFEQVTARGVPLQAYNLREAAHDLVDLRTALGIDQWTIFGTSYGSFWALQYLKLQPAGVRAVILDSPYPPQADPRDSWVAHLNGLSAVFQACESDQQCAAAYPRLRDRFVSLVTQAMASEGGVAAGGQLIGLLNGVNFETASVHLVPRLIDAYERQDQRTVTVILSLDPYGLPRGFDIERASSTGLYLNTTCIEDVPFAGASNARLALREDWPANIVDAAKLTDNSSTDYCNGAWEVPAGDAAFNEPVQSNVPALITVGALDPETPPEFGAVMGATLPSSTLAVLPDSAHAAISRPSACSTAIIARFLDNPAIKPDVSCLATDRPDFNLPGERIRMVRIGR